jgi:FixJ family two-component response regulator
VIILSETLLISIVDDDRSVRTSLQRLIKSAGFNVEIFSSAEGFLEFGDLHDSACLVLDVRLGGMSGLELQRQLAASDCGIPIVFITGHCEDVGAQHQALKAGAASFLCKPFNDRTLLGAIDKAISSRPRSH